MATERRTALLHDRRASPALSGEIPESFSRRVVIEDVRPRVDDGRFPVKRTVGEQVHVAAAIFADGHDTVTAVLRYRAVPHSGWLEVLMSPGAPGTDEWSGTFTVESVGWYEYAVDAWIDPEHATASRVYRVWVDRERARFGAWYEMFPRSAGPDATRSGTFAEAQSLLPRIADLGFDVLYLPPIHPIGTTFRKGPNNTLMAGPTDPGSPWAIGSSAGGHTAVDPALGTVGDFVAFREAAERFGLEVALDLAWQCSPDHPWVHEHPEWFTHRPDGTIKCAENPPKTYQDIYPLDFDCEDWQALWHELHAVTLFWIERGVRIFRVDNPHTKTFGFWEWLIDRVHAQHPDVIFLSEAFTRPRAMHYLAKSGFTQSYTYFTWRNTRNDLIAYLTELTQGPGREYLRPNLFANTPDILHGYLQTGGRPAFEARLLLAATLGANYGIYSGFELAEGRAVPGTEEYADSEKYQFRKWEWGGPGHLEELVAQVNAIRRRHRALQSDWSLRFHDTDNPFLIAYSKTAPGTGGTLLMVINLDPHHMRHGHVDVSFVDGVTFTVQDLLDGATYEWRKGWNYVRLEPGVKQGHIFTIGAQGHGGTGARRG